MLFRRDPDGQDVELSGSTVALEVELQRRVEAGLEQMLGIRFLASEYPTGPWHRRRIDTNFFEKQTKAGRERRQAVEKLAKSGRIQIGLLPTLAQEERPDGSRGPWSESLQPQQLHFEALALRNACNCFVVALSMMRDSEVRKILKGSVVEYFGTTTVKSTKRKLDPNLPTKHWWIVDQIAKAITTVEQLSQHPELAFASVPGYGSDKLFDSGEALTDFIKRVNGARHISGLDEIPPQHVTPHMFRRTMAMLTRDFPGSEVAVGMQLKHVATRALANRTTSGYMQKNPSWAQYLYDAITERRFDRLKQLFAADSRGETIGFGPGADRMREAFAAVRQKAEELRATGQAKRGDIRVEHSLLQRTRFSIRFGKLNHCTMNDDDPVGAKCIEGAIVPDGHRGPSSGPLPALPVRQQCPGPRAPAGLEGRALIPDPAAVRFLAAQEPTGGH